MSIAARPPERTYAVFISYRHADNREQGRQWAAWLHHTLETYEIPPDLVGRINLRGERVPASLYPVFRDEEELPADADLSSNIQRALRNSALLVVLCSPRAVESRFVADEIRAFKELGRADHILALMIDGEPNASDDPRKIDAEGRPLHECLPETLRYGVATPDGGVDWSRRTEPIAADVRPGGMPVQGWTTSAAYREELLRRGIDGREVESLASAYEEQLQLALMKIVAGAIGLPLGEVTQRDKRHAEERLKRARRELSRTDCLFARQLLDLEDHRQAYARLSKAISDDPSNHAAAILGLEELRSRINRGSIRQLPHDAPVETALFSPDGTRILTVSGDCARMWDTASGHLMAGSMRHAELISFAEFSPDGKCVLTASFDGTCRIWDANSGMAILEPLRHEKAVFTAVFHPDSVRILTASEDGTARLWDGTTGRPIGAPVRSRQPVNLAAFSPDGSCILTASGPAARVWDAGARRVLCGPLRHDPYSNIFFAEFSPDGTRILTVASDHVARLWSASSGKLIADPLVHMGITCGTFSPDGTRVLTASSDGTARLWDGRTGKWRVEPIQQHGKIMSAVFSPDGTRLLTASTDGTARLWDAATGQPAAEPFRHPEAVNSACFSPDGARIVTASHDRTARLWDAFTGKPLAMCVRGVGRPGVAQMSHEGGRLLTTAEDNILRSWDVASGRELGHPIPHESWIDAVALSADDARILTVSSQAARVWDAATGTPVTATIPADGWPLGSAGFSPDGHRMLTTSGKLVRIWDAYSGKLAAKPLRHAADVSLARFSPDARRLLTVAGNTAQFWDATSGESLAVTLSHQQNVRFAELSPDGTRLLTITLALYPTARIWDVATGEPCSEPVELEVAPKFVAFSPDGRKLALVMGDSVSMRDAGSWAVCADPIQHVGTIRALAFSPDGRLLLTACDDEKGVVRTSDSSGWQVRVWDVDTGQLLVGPISGSGNVWAGKFSTNGRYMLTKSGMSDSLDAEGGGRNNEEFWCVRLWDVADGRLSDADVARLRLLLEIAGSRRINSRQMMESVPPQDIADLRRDLDAVSDTDRLLRWWWEDPFTRAINATSSMTVPGFVRRCIAEMLEWPDHENLRRDAIRDATDAFPLHPLVLLCLAADGKHGDPGWLASFAVERLLAEPHYLLQGPSPGADADGTAREHERTSGLAEDCFLAARMLQRHGRIDLARKAIERSLRLNSGSEAYRELARELAAATETGAASPRSPRPRRRGRR